MTACLKSASGPFHCSHVSAPTTPAMPHGHPVDTALGWTGSTCQSLRGSNAPWAPRFCSLWHEGWAQMQGETWACSSPVPGKVGSRKDPHPQQQLLPQALWFHPSGTAPAHSGVGKVANMATGFCGLQEPIALGNFCLQLSLAQAWQTGKQMRLFKSFPARAKF